MEHSEIWAGAENTMGALGRLGGYRRVLMEHSEVWAGTAE